MNTIPITICNRRLDVPNVVDESMKYIRFDNYNNPILFDFDFAELDGEYMILHFMQMHLD